MKVVDRTPKPCHHKVANHQHGTRACYVLDQCRCLPCSEANRNAERTRTRAQLYGRWECYVPADAARAHVRALQAQGMGWKRVAVVAGLSESVLWKLLYGAPTRGAGPSKRIRPATEAAILAVQCDLAPGAVVDGTGTARRIQALVACGWSLSKIAARLGIAPGNFTAVAHGRRPVTAGTAKAVAALYDELWNTAPPQDNHRDRIAYSRALNAAKASGWVPPMAWDDDAIDDPTAEPFVGVDHRPGGKRVHVDDVEFLLEDAPLATAQQLADRLGVTRDAVQAATRRAERADLVEQLARNARLRKEHVA